MWLSAIVIIAESNDLKNEKKTAEKKMIADTVFNVKVNACYSLSLRLAVKYLIIFAWRRFYRSTHCTMCTLCAIVNGMGRGRQPKTAVRMKKKKVNRYGKGKDHFIWLDSVHCTIYKWQFNSILLPWSSVRTTNSIVIVTIFKYTYHSHIAKANNFDIQLCKWCEEWKDEVECD